MNILIAVILGLACVGVVLLVIGYATGPRMEQPLWSAFIELLWRAALVTVALWWAVIVVRYAWTGSP